MKICLITNLYKPYARGGAETVVDIVRGALEKKDHKVFIITTKPIFRKQETGNRKQEIYYISGVYYNLDRIPKFLRLFWHIFDMFDLGSYFKVKKILKKEKPDLVMTHCLKGISFLVPRAIKNLKIKHIHILHDIQILHPSGLMFYGKEKILNELFAKIYQKVCRFLFGSPNVIVSPSRWLLDLHETKGFFKDSKREVMPNPTADTEHITQSIEHRANLNNFSFLYVGQIEKHKGILFLIETFKMLFPSESPNREWGACELVIVGDGFKMKSAKMLAENCENIKFFGKKNKEEVAELMRSTCCLIVPSLCYDNSPMVIYEAFAAGLPVIGAEISGISELLNKNAGLLFKPGDEKDLIEKMRYAIENRNSLLNITKASKEKIKGLGAGKYVEKLIGL